MRNQPIGVFDSGIGGLTVAHAIKEYMPNESIVYFGDTEHLPYGEKSDNSIQYFSEKISDFLLKRNCKAIVIACNSASSIAYKKVSAIAKNIPVFNVIDPVIKHVIKICGKSKIGVIGTKATIHSGKYSKEIRNLCPIAEVKSLATPLLVPMIEEGFIEGKISHTIIETYLSNNLLKDLDYLILACTHYPLIHEEIDKFYKGKVCIINSGEIVASYIKEKLTTLELDSKSLESRYHFYASNYTKSFEHSARFFFQKRIKLEEAAIWGKNTSKYIENKL